jgi:hypothetical protein
MRRFDSSRAPATIMEQVCSEQRSAIPALLHSALAISYLDQKAALAHHLWQQSTK